MPVPDSSQPDAQVLMDRVAELESQLKRRDLEMKVNDEQLGIIYKYLLSLQSVIPGALIVLDASGTPQKVNDAALQLLGYDEAEFRESFSVSIFPRCSELLSEMRMRPDRASWLKRYEVGWKHRDGHEIPVLLSARAQPDAADAFGGAVLIGVDLSERRQLELELRQAQKLEAIGQLAAGIAHEINTPMQFIGDNLEFALSVAPGLLDAAVVSQSALSGGTDAVTRLPDPVRRSAAGLDLDFLQQRLPRALERAREGVQRVSRIVHAMKVFSHPNVQKEPADLNEIIANALIITRHDYKLIAEVQFHPQALPLVICRRSEMTQVLINLIVNAAQAIRSASRPGRITLSASPSSDGRAVRIDISDNGTGIADSLQHRVYDPFFTTKPVGEGTGQGLTISRQIVADRHGGRLWFESREGIGTDFHIELPLEPPAGAAS